MTRTDEDRKLFATHTYEGSEWHHDGTYCHPRVSQAIADMIAGDYDLTNFMRNRTGIGPDVRERAEFLFGLSELMDTMMAIGDIEHTNDWDWFVQVETFDGRMYGDYCKDGVLYGYEDPIWGPDGNDAIYCDSFRTSYTSRVDPKDPRKAPEGYTLYQHMGTEGAKDYYENLEIILESWDGTKTITDTLKVRDVKKIIISQR